jgi:Homeodomain-like domain
VASSVIGVVLCPAGLILHASVPEQRGGAAMGWEKAGELAAGITVRAVCSLLAAAAVAAWRWLRRKRAAAPAPLSAGLRRRLAAELRREGWSVRSIAGRLGCSETTVRRDLAKSDPGKPGP